MGTNERGGWSIAIVVVSVLVGLMLLLWLVLPLIGMFD